MPKHECAVSHATNVLQRLCSTTEDIYNTRVWVFSDTQLLRTFLNKWVGSYNVNNTLNLEFGVGWGG